LYLFDPGEQAAVVSHEILTITESSQWILTYQAHISANEALGLICQKKNDSFNPENKNRVALAGRVKKDLD